MRVRLCTTPVRLVGAVLAAALVAVMPPTAANAVESAADVCRTGYFCIFEHSGYVGRYWAFPQSVNVPYVGDFMNDRMTSFQNRTSRYVCLYETANYGHQMVPHGFAAIPSGGYASNVNDFANDKLSSIKFGSSYPSCG